MPFAQNNLLIISITTIPVTNPASVPAKKIKINSNIKNENVLLFDPYYWDKPYEQEDILMDDKHPKEYNRIVPFKYFNQENKETIYALGPVEEREAVLIFNEKTKTVPEEVIEYFI